jgi:hypothetical protein
MKQQRLNDGPMTAYRADRTRGSQCNGPQQNQSGKGDVMVKPVLSRFQYTRKHGKQRTYDVTVNLVQKASGVCSYAAWVHFESRFKGSGLMLPLVASTRDAAVQEAKKRIQEDIENLIGIDE